MEPAAVTTFRQGARIGLIADTHCGDERKLPRSVFEAFRDTQLIVHLGDCGAAAALDALEDVAPLVATRGVDDPAGDSRFTDLRLLEVGGLQIGALFDLTRIGLNLERGAPDGSAAGTLRTTLGTTFGAPVEVVVFAATHQPMVAHQTGVLFVNPGSATLPVRPGPRGLGTVALLDVRQGVATVEIVDL